MNRQEVHSLVLTYYEDESQTLTSDREANLLKLKEIAGTLSAGEKERWEQIKVMFGKNNKLVGIDRNNQAGMVLAQLSEFNEHLEGIKRVIDRK